MEDSAIITPSRYTLATFTPFVGDTFSIPVLESDPIGLILISAEFVKLKPYDGRAIGKSGNVRHDPFILLFRGPQDKQLGQGTFLFNHAQMGAFKMGIVPVGPGETGMLYEVIFN